MPTTALRAPPSLRATTHAASNAAAPRTRRALHVLLCPSDGGAHGGLLPHRHGHDVMTKTSVAASLADLLGYAFSGAVDADAAVHTGGYLVPSDTLCSLGEARALGVRGVHDLFGGVVPHPFVATKLVSHGLWRQSAAAPQGWNHELGTALGDAVLPGFVVFNADDAWHAGNALLAMGPVRLKESAGVGGSGQSVALDRRELASQIEDIGPDLLAQGFVVECNLMADVVVHSVGQVQVGDWTASYVGDQHTTRNHRGHEVYGGSNLLVARGGYDALLRLDLSQGERLAVAQALRYQAATQAAYPAMFTSRNNYDVAQGRDGHGRWRSGVLEQSWRIGGGSGAEIAALHAFKRDGSSVVRASTHEVYADVAPPLGATVHYDGTDARVGRLLKYTLVERQPTG